MTARKTLQKKLKNESGVFLPLLLAIGIGLVSFFIVLAVDFRLAAEANTKSQTLSDLYCEMAVKALPFTSQAVSLVGAALPPTKDVGYRLELTEVLVTIPTVLVGDPASPWSGGYSWPDGTSFSTFSIPGCPADVECKIENNVNDPLNFPAGFWSTDDYNNFIACEVSITAKPFILEEKVGRGKAAHGVGLKNTATVAQNDGRSVILAIDPHLVIHEANPRFDFSNPSSPIYAKYSPLNPSSVAFLYNSPISGGPVNLSDLEKSIDGTTKFALPLKNVNAPTLAPQRRNLQMGCYNGLKAVQNKTAQLLAENFSRFGRWAKDSSLPQGFQVLLLNSLGNDNSPNLPTQIKAPGDDPFKKKFFLPFVNQRASSSSNWRCGFDHTACTEDDLVFMGQLRDCYHINSGLPGGSYTFQPKNIHNKFEPKPPNDFKSEEATAPTFVSGGNLVTWGQFRNDDTQMETLPQVLSFMGRVERCPKGSSAPPPACSKPNINNFSDPTQDLRPDISSMLDYVLGNVRAYDKLGPVFSPTNLNASPDQVPRGTVSSPPDFISNHIVLILSKRLDPSRISAISQRVTTLYNDRGTRIFVLFFSTSTSDEDLATFNNLEAAFRGQGRDENMILRITPPDSLNPCVGGHTAACYSFAWETYATSGGEYNVESVVDMILDWLLVRNVAL